MLSRSANNHSVKGFIFCNNKEEVIDRLKDYENSKPKRVCQYSLNGELINTFNSINDACVQLNCKNQTTIKKCCDGLYK